METATDKQRRVWPWSEPVTGDADGAPATWASEGTAPAVGDLLHQSGRSYEVISVEPAEVPEYAKTLRRITLRSL